MEPLIINFTPTGMLMMKEDTPYVPLNVKEIVEEVRAAYNLGITSVHLHARDEITGKPCYEKEVFEEIILGIRDYAPDLVIAVTTSGRLYNTYEKRSDVLNLEGKAKPDMGSLTLSSLNFNKTASVNAPDMIVSLLKRMNEAGIKPELEVFDCGMVNYAKYLIRKELLKPPYYFNIILGNIACAQATLLHSGVIINDLPENSVCSIGAIGNYQLNINALAIAMGFGVRVGLEDNIWFDDERTRLATNMDLLKRIHLLANSLNREICTPGELRKKLDLKDGFGEYGIK